MPRDLDPATIPMKSLLLRPARWVALVFALVLIVALGALSLFTWLDFERTQSIRSHVNRTSLLQQSLMQLKGIQLQMVTQKGPPDRVKLDAARAALGQIPTKGAPIGSYMAERLGRLNRLLALAETQPGDSLQAAIALLNEMLERENRIQLDLLEAVYDDTRLDTRLALAALVGFPSLVLLALWGLRQRVFRPIEDLRHFLVRLANRDFAPVSLADIDPLLLPLFQNYNQMVDRLRQLERTDRERTMSLEQEVRSATHALLRQQQSLARAQRLAAAGEVSATLAHELRNPIAGIQITLANLRRELQNPELAERVDLVVTELKRITRLLNELLQQSSHVPELPRLVNVDRLIRELATLLRYQLPTHIRLATHVPNDLRCRLPEDGVRQAVLNLVLNSVAAIGEAPGTITIHLEYREGALEIEVVDDGTGFPETILSAGIRAFATSRESGTGLGLAIVKRFARDLGGELAIANRAPCGACVRLTLPCELADVGHALAHRG
ncbi:MAG: two-component sensor histidine kinase [Proteobacteria bacterium]|nr:MAG: two-component sensor histidine kinase [Pseudomonadota bacterium]